MRWGLLLVIGTAIVAAACGAAGTAQPTTSPTDESAAVRWPTSAAAGLRNGVWVEVDSADGCLEVRVGRLPGSPGNCLRPGFVGLIVDGPDESGGRTWWMLAGQGWLPEGNLRFHHVGGIPYPPRPELVMEGFIAYVDDDGDVWVISADGSQQRRLIDIEGVVGPDSGVRDIVWSPGGDAIAASTFTRVGVDMTVEKGSGRRVYTVLVMDPDGAVLATVSNALLASWSPDGTKLALLADWSDELGVEPVCAFSNSAVIAVFDLLSAETTPVTPRGCYFDGPQWSPDGGSLLYTRDGDIYMYSLAEDTERLVKAHGEEDWYWTVSWAPDGSRVSAFHHVPTTDTSLGSYEVFELGAEEPLVSFAEPRGGCGREAVAGDWRTRWTADGSYLLYHEPCGEPGFSGVWIGDVATGKTVRIPVNGAGGVTSSPNGRHVLFHTSGFGSGNHIWVADVDGSNLTLLAEGGNPTWQPLPALLR